MSQRYAILFLMLCFFSMWVTAQHFKALNGQVNNALSAQGNFHEMVKLSLSTGIKTGTSVGLSYGMWKEGPTLQYSLNTGFMWRFGKHSLGNYHNASFPNDSRTRGQFVFMFSPLLTTRLSRKDHVYQEVEPFYWGTPVAIFNKFCHSLTLGTTFTISPRGYRNVATIRNRAQQVFMISLNVKDINLTIYDDYFPFFTKNLQLGDNWDRFFTGGGFLRFRFSDEYRLHLYSEVYTGINRAISFLYPDIISYRKVGRNWQRKNMANQDPGQEYFNYSWFFGKLSYSGNNRIQNNQHVYLPDLHLSLGTPASWTMFSQNWIHDMFTVDKDNNLKLHYFLNRRNVPGNLDIGTKKGLKNIRHKLALGAGASYNVIKF